jgi:hypothetical protein
MVAEEVCRRLPKYLPSPKPGETCKAVQGLAMVKRHKRLGSHGEKTQNALPKI